MTTTEKLAEALRMAIGRGAMGIVPTGQDLREWRAAIAAHEDELAATPASPDLYVGLIERLMRLSTRLGIAHEGGVEHFAASLEDRLYTICRVAESLLDSLAATNEVSEMPAAPLTDEQIATRIVQEFGTYAPPAGYSTDDMVEAFKLGAGQGKESSNG